jgi:hypothetical protein
MEEKKSFKVRRATKKEQRNDWIWLVLAIAVGVIIAGWFLWKWLAPSKVDAKPEPACKVENAECKTNDSNKLCCQGLVCMDKGLPSENGKCQAEPTPTPTPLPTPTPTLAPVCPTWTCGECQGENDGEALLFRVEENSCQKEKQYCEENYGCKEVCPTEDKCKKDEKIWVCDCPPEPTPTPEVTPTPTPEVKIQTTESKPEGCTSNCGVPACTDQVPEPVVNPHIYRQGDTALVKWYPKQGDKVNIYWKLNGASDWQHALANSPNDGYEEIKGLGNQDWTFGLQSVAGCAADGIVNASVISEVIDGNTSSWVLFR